MNGHRSDKRNSILGKNKKHHRGPEARRKVRRGRKPKASKVGKKHFRAYMADHPEVGGGYCRNTRKKDRRKCK
jgi:hypothetical protein